MKDEQHGFDLGAVDYITKPIQPAVVVARVRLHLELKQARDRLAEQNDMLEERIQERTRELERSQPITAYDSWIYQPINTIWERCLCFDLLSSICCLGWFIFS